MTDHGHFYDYPATVGVQINDELINDYIRAAEFLNNGHFDVVSLQHEFGIFGGEAGSETIQLLSLLKMPIMTTLHTVLAETSTAPHKRMSSHALSRMSSKVVVMAEKKVGNCFRTIYQVAEEKIEIIPHGNPGIRFCGARRCKKTRLGFAGRSVILTFGLLSSTIKASNS